MNNLYTELRCAVTLLQDKPRQRARGAERNRYAWARLKNIGDEFFVRVSGERREMTRKSIQTAAKQKGMRVSVRREADGLKVERVA